MRHSVSYENFPSAARINSRNKLEKAGSGREEKGKSWWWWAGSGRARLKVIKKFLDLVLVWRRHR